MTIELSEWGSRNVLEALCTLEQKWLNIIHNSTDEDKQAEYGNDLALLRLTKDRIHDQAVQAFGSSLAEFDRLVV